MNFMFFAAFINFEICNTICAECFMIITTEKAPNSLEGKFMIQQSYEQEISCL